MSIEKLEEAMTNEYSNRMFNLEYRQLKMKIYAYGNSMFFAIAIFILLVDVIVNKEPNNDIKNIYIFTFYLCQLIILSVYYIPCGKRIYDYIDIKNIGEVLSLLNNYKVNLPQYSQMKILDFKKEI